MERSLLAHVPGPILAVLIVAVAVALSTAGVLMVRKLVPAATLQEHNDVAGFIIAVIGLLYGVLLAFVVIIVWQHYDAATSNASQEANLVDHLYRQAAYYPGETAPIRQSLLAYADSVVHVEWHTMSVNGHDNPRTDEILGTLQDDFKSVQITSPQEQTFYMATVGQLYSLADVRRQRLDDNQGQLPGALWVVLIAGGAITVGFTYLFGVPKVRPQILMVGSLAAMIALTLFLVLSLDLPFSGSLRVGPTAMENAITEFSHIAATGAM